MNFREIAAKAGVSVATISRVINQPNSVLPETREKVLCVMKEVGYNVNSAKGGNVVPVNGIAVIVPSAIKTEYNSFIQGIISVTSRRNFRVSVFYSNGEIETERQLIHDILNYKYKGGIFMETNLSNGDAHELHLKSFPFVLAQCAAGNTKENVCCINVGEGAYLLTKHLLELKYKHIMLMAEEDSAFVGISEGCKRAAEEAKVGINRMSLEKGENGFKGGMKCAKRIVDMPKEKRPDAVLCPNDLFAIGMLRMFESQKIQVPGDIAVASLRDNELGEVASVELTRIICPFNRLGMMSARMLFDLFEDEQEDIPQEVVLQPKLEIGKSCGNDRDIVAEFL
ncbi:MAG: LacI family DNA-binding transcriptional regulator [Roseburia sp.]|nr:LacI family DNA-binding transcriptional regulator [Roseburia sp.]